MLDCNSLISGLALAFAGFAYAFTLCFIFFASAPFWDTLIAIAGGSVGTLANYWVLTSSLPSLGIVALMFLSQAVTVGFIGVFLPEGIFAAAFLNAGTLALAITSRYTTFSQPKIMVILVVFLVVFTFFWAAHFGMRNAN